MAYLPHKDCQLYGFPHGIMSCWSGCYPLFRLFRCLTKHDLEHVQRALESVGMWENRHKQIDISQVQSSAIARILLQILISSSFDEPTTVGLDDRNSQYLL